MVKGTWESLDDLKGRTFRVEEAYDTELTLVEVSNGAILNIVLEDSGLGYGEDGYTEYLVMTAYIHAPRAL